MHHTVSTTSEDTLFLKKTLQLARKGMGWTQPNPMVGAVLVKNGKIIAKGYHKKVGLPHAEIEAIKNAKTSLKSATLYVNLEPCAHYGRTPPCVDAIIKAGITRMVCSTLDPNPSVHGQGIGRLKKAGISVSVGLLENEAKRLNEAFFTFHEKKRPFIALKFAASLDGKIATYTGDSKWITNEKARTFARSLRSHYQSILVGINTIISDNPHLGVREKGEKDPLRIIFDTTLRIPVDSQVLRDSNVLLVTTKKAKKEKKTQLEKRGISILVFHSEQISLRELVLELGKRNIISILVEGGGEVLGSFVDKKLMDKIYAFHAPIIIGGQKAMTIEGKGADRIQDALRLKHIAFKKFGDNMLTIGYVR